MTSYLISSSDQKESKKFLQQLVAENNISPFDKTTLTRETTKKSTSSTLATSIGIDDIKQLQRAIFLKPIKSKTKAVIIEDAQLLTIEAQNALLKVLEEPPSHTIIILITTTKEALLPTIRSRCQIITGTITKIKLSQKEYDEYTQFLTTFPRWGIDMRLKKAEQLAKDKTKALLWIEKLILVTREELLKQTHEHNQLTILIRHVQSLHTMLQTTNVNPRFAIENTLLTL
jgi:DNA polymerase III delta prime subunit